MNSHGVLSMFLDYFDPVWLNQLPIFQSCQDGWCVEVLVEEAEVTAEDSSVKQSLLQLLQLLKMMNT